MARKRRGRARRRYRLRMTKDIFILPNGHVDIGDCPVWPGDQVRWGTLSGPWLVHFTRKAFREQDFTVPARGFSDWSGPPVGSKGRYPYKVMRGKRVADPNIIIK